MSSRAAQIPQAAVYPIRGNCPRGIVERMAWQAAQRWLPSCAATTAPSRWHRVFLEPLDFRTC